MIEFIMANLNYVIPIIVGIVALAMLAFKMVTVAQAKELVVYAWGMFNNKASLATNVITNSVLGEVTDYVSANASGSVLKHINKLGIKAEKHKEKATFGDKLMGGVGQVLTNSAVTMATNWVKKW
jgi:hypothetical protein